MVSIQSPLQRPYLATGHKIVPFRLFGSLLQRPEFHSFWQLLLAGMLRTAMVSTDARSLSPDVVKNGENGAESIKAARSEICLGFMARCRIIFS
ncbi:hypothetical protein KCP78_12450 [Salmonella enterica subsp. enterica]|nr:hypothetical protein KCP78_12450 [Salmonella enterica subsp. enterica]